MKKHLYFLAMALICTFGTLNAAVGDTTWVQSFNGQFTHYGTYDTTIGFPSGATTYRKIYMIFTMGEYNCGGGTCHQWDYDLENTLMTPGGDTIEIARFISPYATGGTPGFTATWEQHYIFDVTDFYPLLHDSATMQINYSGYSWGFNGDVKFAFIEGTPERNVLGHDRLWQSTYSYGNLANLIDSNVLPYTLTPPAGAQSSEMKLIITGHGSDQASQCCEFDNTGVGHTYTVVANGNTAAQYNMNINCGWSELYPQGGTWLYARAGNWCPGGLVNQAQYPLPGVTASSPYTVDLNFDDSYNGVGSYGIYKISACMFYYGNYNKTLDASLEDVIAPTNFEWYRRENPRASAPVVKVRNTGGTAITSMLLMYGVKDSALSQYLWTGSLAPSADTIITLPPLPAITNLSLGAATGNYSFIAQIITVNGQTDNDQSNDTITSNFSVAPTYPSSFVVKLQTSSIGASGNFGSNPADASWQITDQNGIIVASRTNANVVTTYNDTVNLTSAGFYTLTVTSSQCYGLSWWALVGQTGYTAGSFKVLDYNNFNTELPLDGNNPGSSFHDDFGCGFTQYFTTMGTCQAVTPTITRDGDTLIASAGASYQWYRNGNKINGATNQTFTGGGAHYNYSVAVTDGSGCTATSASMPFYGTGVVSLSELSEEVSLYPNPANTTVTLLIPAELTGSTYTVYDVMGRQVLSGKAVNENTPISVSAVTSGIYIVVISDGTSSINKRITIQRQ